jgi:hypothetical protein
LFSETGDCTHNRIVGVMTIFRQLSYDPQITKNSDPGSAPWQRNFVRSEPWRERSPTSGAKFNYVPSNANGHRPVADCPHRSPLGLLVSRSFLRLRANEGIVQLRQRIQGHHPCKVLFCFGTVPLRLISLIEAKQVSRIRGGGHDVAEPPFRQASAEYPQSHPRPWS